VSWERLADRMMYLGECCSCPVGLECRRAVAAWPHKERRLAPDIPASLGYRTETHCQKEIHILSATWLSYSRGEEGYESVYFASVCFCSCQSLVFFCLATSSSLFYLSAFYIHQGQRSDTFMGGSDSKPHCIKTRLCCLVVIFKLHLHLFIQQMFFLSKAIKIKLTHSEDLWQYDESRIGQIWKKCWIVLKKKKACVRWRAQLH